MRIAYISTAWVNSLSTLALSCLRRAVCFVNHILAVYFSADMALRAISPNDCDRNNSFENVMTSTKLHTQMIMMDERMIHNMGTVTAKNIPTFYSHSSTSRLLYFCKTRDNKLRWEK